MKLVVILEFLGVGAGHELGGEKHVGGMATSHKTRRSCQRSWASSAAREQGTLLLFQFFLPCDTDNPHTTHSSCCEHHTHKHTHAAAVAVLGVDCVCRVCARASTPPEPKLKLARDRGCAGVRASGRVVKN